MIQRERIVLNRLNGRVVRHAPVSKPTCTMLTLLKIPICMAFAVADATVSIRSRVNAPAHEAQQNDGLFGAVLSESDLLALQTSAHNVRIFNGTNGTDSAICSSGVLMENIFDAQPQAILATSNTGSLYFGRSDYGPTGKYTLCFNGTAVYFIYFGTLWM